MHAQILVRGAWTLHEVTGKVAISSKGEELEMYEFDEIPRFFSGLIKCEADQGSRAFLSSSNRSYIFFYGQGSFALERFEHSFPELDEWNLGRQEANQSRTILNFREGRVTMDNRKMLDISELLVVTPLGSVSVSGALWQMQILFDRGTQRFDFYISCSDGLLKFKDIQDKQYILRTGQRLSGAGYLNNPSIELGEITDRCIERVKFFLESVKLYENSANDLTLYLPKLEVIERDYFGDKISYAENASYRNLKPVIIEYAKDPPAVTPFRGQIRAPSIDEANLF